MSTFRTSILLPSAIASALLGCSEVAPTGGDLLEPMLSLEDPASTDCIENVTVWVWNGHLHEGSGFQGPQTCWEYANAASVYIAASYAMRSSAGHFNGEIHKWYVVGLDHTGSEVGTPMLIDSLVRDADTWYLDDYEIAIPENSEAARVWMAVEDDNYDVHLTTFSFTCTRNSLRQATLL